MCCIAELLLETACIKGQNWRGQIVSVMEDGLWLCQWYNSVFHRFLWVLFTSVLQFQCRAITEDCILFLYFIPVHFFSVLLQSFFFVNGLIRFSDLNIGVVSLHFFLSLSPVVCIYTSVLTGPGLKQVVNQFRAPAFPQMCHSTPNCSVAQPN